MREWLKSVSYNAGAIATFFGLSAITVIGITVINDSPTPDNGNRESVTVTIPVSDSQKVGTRVTIPPCATEDSDNCYWMAETMGNGKGMSFVTIDGQTYYLSGN